MNALVRAEIYASLHKAEVAKLLSKDGDGYLPLPAPVIERAMTYYDAAFYGESGAIRHPEWHIGRIDFQPWPYPSATKLIVGAMNETLVGGDATFLKKLDPEFVAKDLVNYDFVRNAMTKYPQWKDDPSVSPNDPFNRTEVLAL
jgi:NitT/TauT family transport system substrate-binding protein